MDICASIFVEMHPKFKISKLTNLQDARYSAALGFDMVSFSLARGERQKLPATLIWNIANWLEGPEIVLDLNAESWEELSEVTFDFHYLSLPWQDFEPQVAQKAQAFVLKGDDSLGIDQIQTLRAAYPTLSLKFELSFDSVEAAMSYQEVFPDLLINFRQLSLYFDFFKQQQATQVWGISLQNEAEEELGYLDYEQIDELMGMFSDVHL